jgi:hypothetical protein
MAGKDPRTDTTRPDGEKPARKLSAAARRALAEAEARRAAAKAEHREREIGGPKGPEPVRYGDWEVKGRAVDF